MSAKIRLFGVELSPYSLKVRSYFRYKKIRHEWVPRNSTNKPAFERFAKLPLVPLVVMPAGESMQDSTPIMEHFEKLHTNPSIFPVSPALAFLTALIEEYGDEWGNKQMFHYRWTYEPDQKATAKRIVSLTRPGLNPEEVSAAVEQVRARMVPRLSFVGSSESTRDHIESSFDRLLSILEKHIGQRMYLFGGRPTFGDFGLGAQLYQCATDPTAGAIMRTVAPNVLSWTEEMLDPKDDGDLENWDDLQPTLEPLLREIGQTFLPWTVANARALTAEERRCSLLLRGKEYAQETRKYHARSFNVLQKRYSAIPDKGELNRILSNVNCLEWFQ